MRGCTSWFAVVFWSCASCCCLRVPTCGMWPEVDATEIAARVRDAPITVDHLCRVGETCAAVEGATVDVWPLAWGPIFGEVTVLVEVEATCTQSTDPRERLEPIACAGMLLAVYDGSGEVLQFVTENTFGAKPSGLTLEEWNDASGDADWD